MEIDTCKAVNKEVVKACFMNNSIMVNDVQIQKCLCRSRSSTKPDINRPPPRLGTECEAEGIIWPRQMFIMHCRTADLANKSN